MFSKNHMTVGSWWVFFILMAIPVLNVVMFFVILLSGETNKSLKNYLLAIVLPFFIIFILMFFFGIGVGMFDRFGDFFGRFR